MLDIGPQTPPAEPAGAGDVLATACHAMEELLDGLFAVNPADITAEQLLAAIATSGHLMDRLEAFRLRWLRAAETTGAIREDGGRSAGSWLRSHSTLSGAGAAHRAAWARELETLPVVADAFAAGRIGAAHVRAVHGLIRDAGDERVAAVQDELVVAAESLPDADAFTRLCRTWRHALAPDAADAEDRRAYERRRLSLSPTFDGVWHVEGRFDAESGAIVHTALQSLMRPDPAGTPSEECRSAGARCADAAVEMARRFLASGEAPVIAGLRPQVMVRIDADDVVTLRHLGDLADLARATGVKAASDRAMDDLLADLRGGPGAGAPDGDARADDEGRSGAAAVAQLVARLRRRAEEAGILLRPRPARRAPTIDGVGPVALAAALRILDDAAIVPIVTGADGRVLDVGTTTRLWPTRIRRAITARDGGCRFPGCGAPVTWCDIDHIVEVSDLGPTSYDNGMLLCRRHHRMKRPDRWWPRMDPDTGVVRWRHPRHGERVSRPHPNTNRWVQRLEAHRDDNSVQPDTVGEQRVTYRARAGPAASLRPARRSEVLATCSRPPWPGRGDPPVARRRRPQRVTDVPPSRGSPPRRPPPGRA